MIWRSVFSVALPRLFLWIHLTSRLFWQTFCTEELRLVCWENGQTGFNIRVYVYLNVCFLQHEVNHGNPQWSTILHLLTIDPTGDLWFIHGIPPGICPTLVRRFPHWTHSSRDWMLQTEPGLGREIWCGEQIWKTTMLCLKMLSIPPEIIILK